MTCALLLSLAALPFLVAALLAREFGIAGLAVAVGLLSVLLSSGRPRPPWTLFLVLYAGLGVGGAVTIGGPWPAVGVALALAGWEVGLSQTDLEGFPKAQRERAAQGRAVRSMAIPLGGAGVAALALGLSLEVQFSYVLALAAASPLVLAFLFRLVPLDRPPRPRRRR